MLLLKWWITCSLIILIGLLYNLVIKLNNNSLNDPMYLKIKPTEGCPNYLDGYHNWIVTKRMGKHPIKGKCEYCGKKINIETKS